MAIAQCDLTNLADPPRRSPEEQLSLCVLGIAALGMAPDNRIARFERPSGRDRSQARAWSGFYHDLTIRSLDAFAPLTRFASMNSPSQSRYSAICFREGSRKCVARNAGLTIAKEQSSAATAPRHLPQNALDAVRLTSPEQNSATSAPHRCRLHRPLFNLPINLRSQSV